MKAHYALTVKEPIIEPWSYRTRNQTKRKVIHVETTFFGDEKYTGFIVYPLRKVDQYGGKGNRVKSSNDKPLWRVVHKESGFCVAQCESTDIKNVVQLFNEIDFDAPLVKGKLHGFVGGLEVFMNLELKHTIVEIKEKE